ncbi:neurofilament heavy polypeptide, partial [Penaeus vannamei]|uniref:neurofilament heavy polypeptide n=1 Tax=Penaeus vannamei TaxID=6689 RepID=UPI00387F7E3C
MGVSSTPSDTPLDPFLETLRLRLLKVMMKQTESVEDGGGGDGGDGGGGGGEEKVSATASTQVTVDANATSVTTVTDNAEETSTKTTTSKFTKTTKVKTIKIVKKKNPNSLVANAIGQFNKKSEEEVSPPKKIVFKKSSESPKKVPGLPKKIIKTGENDSDTKTTDSPEAKDSSDSKKENGEKTPTSSRASAEKSSSESKEIPAKKEPSVKKESTEREASTPKTDAKDTTDKKEFSAKRDSTERKESPEKDSIEKKERVAKRESSERKETPEKKETGEKKESIAKRDSLERKETPEKKETVEKKESPVKRGSMERKASPAKRDSLEKKGTIEKNKSVEKRDTPESRESPLKKKSPLKKETPERKGSPARKTPPAKTEKEVTESKESSDVKAATTKEAEGKEDIATKEISKENAEATTIIDSPKETAPDSPKEEAQDKSESEDTKELAKTEASPEPEPSTRVKEPSSVIEITRASSSSSRSSKSPLSEYVEGAKAISAEASSGSVDKVLTSESDSCAEGASATPCSNDSKPRADSLLDSDSELSNVSVFVIVRDMSSLTARVNKETIVTPATSTCGELMQEVGRRFKYEPDSFSLILQCSNGDQVEIDKMEAERTLADARFQVEGTPRNNLILCDLGGHPPRRTDEDDLSLGASASPTASASEKKWFDRSSTYSNTPEYSYSAALIKHETGYVGLVNQAMTCYLNSLLQTLYMTPEFRNAIYQWEFKGSEEEAAKNIPCQIQRLFLLLQTTNKTAVETTNLTKSFGWDSSEAWQQHDIQELCRVMFDALEQCFKNTHQSDLINSLYEGKMKDYVKCLECGNEGAREDTYLDIPLPIRPFGSSSAYKSVEEALRAFVEPELLTGNNKYKCSKCDSLCDAHKGLKFTRFPYLLTIHLMRFDFDYQTLHRIKLN